MSKTPEERTDVMVRPTMDAVLAAFVPMLARIPDAEDDDGSGIIAGILASDDWEDWNPGGSMPDAESTVGKRQKIVTVTKKPSDIEGSLPFYLIVDAVDRDTGEVLRWQTSSHTIAAQLVKAHLAGRLPIIAEVVKSEKPTKGGFYPLQLKIQAVSEAIQG